MKTRITALLTGLAIGGTLLFASAGIVTATNAPSGLSGKGVCATQAAAMKASPSVDTIRAFGDCEIGRRLTDLTTMSGKITDSKRLTTSDAAELQGEIAADKTGLTALKTTIDAETDITTLKAEVARIASDFRVYVLLARKVNLVSGADGIIAAQSKFATVNTNLSDRIAKEKAAGKDTTAAEAALAAMNTAVSNAETIASTLPAKLLALTPAEWNGGIAKPILDAARVSLGQARDDLKTAVADAKACRDALK